ncbi:hypothetical protein BB559_005891 [Furculomyces boomerangus]|uniref:Phosphatidate phosphatase APP1 catalytic domain-containing protein n=1 Tax=Furculomyces boomerangus TaxID=61424 RepID=A0A2T9Y635_9FUNG|nr:hypothetical protein BB559_005891 [Furculomyces boomerangus]
MDTSPKTIKKVRFSEDAPIHYTYIPDHYEDSYKKPKAVGESRLPGTLFPKSQIVEKKKSSLASTIRLFISIVVPVNNNNIISNTSPNHLGALKTLIGVKKNTKNEGTFLQRMDYLLCHPIEKAKVQIRISKHIAKPTNTEKKVPPKIPLKPPHLKAINFPKINIPELPKNLKGIRRISINEKITTIDALYGFEVENGQISGEILVLDDILYQNSSNETIKIVIDGDLIQPSLIPREIGANNNYNTKNQSSIPVISELNINNTQNPFSSTEIKLVKSHGVSVISDIDDTIKDLNFNLGKIKAMETVLVNDATVVEGMHEVYANWQKYLGAEFHYVSNSPQQLFPVIYEFIKAFQLPITSIHLRKFDKSKILSKSNLTGTVNNKYDFIVDLIQKFPKRKYILVGDSGEKDLEIYCSIARRFKDQIERIYIRDIFVDDSALPQSDISRIDEDELKELNEIDIFASQSNNSLSFEDKAIEQEIIHEYVNEHYPLAYDDNAFLKDNNSPTITSETTNTVITQEPSTSITEKSISRNLTTASSTKDSYMSSTQSFGYGLVEKVKSSSKYTQFRGAISSIKSKATEFSTSVIYGQNEESYSGGDSNFGKNNTNDNFLNADVNTNNTSNIQASSSESSFALDKNTSNNSKNNISISEYINNGQTFSFYNISTYNLISVENVWQLYVDPAAAKLENLTLIEPKLYPEPSLENKGEYSPQLQTRKPTETKNNLRNGTEGKTFQESSKLGSKKNSFPNFMSLSRSNSSKSINELSRNLSRSNSSVSKNMKNMKNTKLFSQNRMNFWENAINLSKNLPHGLIQLFINGNDLITCDISSMYGFTDI